MSKLFAAVFGFVYLLLAGACVAEPVVEHLEPPSLGRGAKNRLALVGSDIDRAIGIWTSLPSDKLKISPALTSDPQRAEFEIDVAADCPAGLYGLRLATEDGLSNLQLFLVDDLLPLTPPTNSPLGPFEKYPLAIAGQFRTADRDRYPIQVQAGQWLSFDVVASRFGTDADPLVTIYDAAGRRIVERDNDPGLFFDCCFEHTFDNAGIYTVEVRDARFQGSPHWRYVLRIGSFPAARVTLPSAVRPGETTRLRFPELPDASVPFAAPPDLLLGGFYFSFRRPNDAAGNWFPLLATPHRSVVEAEPNDTLDQATPAEAAPVWLHGVCDRPGDRDNFAFDVKKGERLVIRAETKAIQSAADVELIVVDPMGREVQRVDDVTPPGSGPDEASLTFTVGQDGKYRLLVREVSDAGGPDFSYRIELQPVVPRFQLAADVAALSVPQDSYQVIPLTVTRSEFNGPIELSLVGGPPGLKLEPTTIAEGATTVVCKLFATVATPPGIYSFTIAGKGQSGEATIAALATTQPMVDRQLINVDLIKHALRDNQRWLPPSVKTGLALLVTPPAPFTFEPADAIVTLPRYQQASLSIQTTRAAGSDGPITFAATGGQLGEESQGRRQVFARFPTATPAQPTITATFHSRSQAQDLKERIDISATAKHGSRSITLTRSVTLAVRPAFEVTLEPAQVTVAPGGTVKIKLVAARLNSFSGDVTIMPTTSMGVTLPTTITIPAGQPSVEVDILVAADSKPRREKIRFPATATVNGFQEEPRPVELDLEVKLEAKEPPAK